MTARLVPTVRTKYTLNQLIGGLVEGWFKKFGVIPRKESIGVLYAQNALETGGTVSMWNNNIGNVKYVPTAGDDDWEYMMLANVWEVVNGQKITFQPPHPATWFRAFPTLADGIAWHFDFLKNHRYAKAWTAVEAGNPAAFAHLLKVAGYYTAPEADYVRLMNTYFNRFMRDPTYEQEVARLMPPPPEPDPTPEPTPEPVPVPQPDPGSDPQPMPPPVPQPPTAPARDWVQIILNAVFPFLRLFKLFKK